MFEQKAKLNGVIGLIGQALARYAAPYDSIIHLSCPPGVDFVQARGGTPAQAHNAVIQAAMQFGAEWVLFLDDDNIWPTDMVHRLLAHEVDIVSGLYLERCPPWRPLVGYAEDENHHWVARCLKPGDQGLHKVLMVGGGCLLIRRRVFEALGLPVWRVGAVPKAADEWGDDVDFCRRARAAGFDVHVDLDVRCGHMFVVCIWPHKDEKGEWHSVLAQENNVIAHWPATTSLLEQSLDDEVLVDDKQMGYWVGRPPQNKPAETPPHNKVVGDVCVDR